MHVCECLCMHVTFCTLCERISSRLVVAVARKAIKTVNYECMREVLCLCLWARARVVWLVSYGFDFKARYHNNKYTVIWIALHFQNGEQLNVIFSLRMKKNKHNFFLAIIIITYPLRKRLAPPTGMVSGNIMLNILSKIYPTWQRCGF